MYRRSRETPFGKPSKLFKHGKHLPTSRHCCCAIDFALLVTEPLVAAGLYLIDAVVGRTGPSGARPGGGLARWLWTNRATSYETTAGTSLQEPLGKEFDRC